MFTEDDVRSSRRASDLSDLFQSAPTPVVIARGRQIVYVNPAALSFLAPGCNSLTPEAANSLFNELSWAITCVQTGHVVSSEDASLPRKGGRTVKGKLSAWPISLVDGPAVQLSFELPAPADRIAQEAELRLQSLQSIYRTVPVGLAYLDENLQYVYVNELLAEINGHPPAHHIGRSIREILSPDLCDEIEPLLREVIESGEAVMNLELRFPHATNRNEVRDWLVHYFPGTLNGQRGLHGVLIDITDRKNMERQLALSERRFRATFEQNSIGIAHVGLDGRWLDVNQRLCDIVGYSREELLQKTFGEITHPDDLAEDLLSSYRDLLMGRAGRYSIEKRYMRKDGQVVWVNLTGSLMRDADGIPQYEIAVIEDITQRKLATAEGDESRKRLQAALDASSTGTFRWDILTNELTWDENLDRIFGLSPGRTAKSLDQFIAMVHPDDRKGVISRCERCAKEGADFEMEFRVLYPDGSVHWIYDRGKRWADGDGSVYMTGACVDITEHKAVMEALRDSEERRRLAMQASESGSFEYDLVTGINRWSPEIERLYGLKEGTFRGTYEAWEQCVYPPDLPATEEKVRQSLVTGNLEAEWRIVKADTGELRWISARGKVLHDENGRPARMVGINLDITRSKQIELELRRNSQILDQIHDAVIATDLEGNVTLWNRGAEQRFGYTAEEALGRHVSLIYPPEDHWFLMEKIVAPLKENGTHDIEVRNVTKDGKEFFGHLSLSMFNDENGAPIGMIGYTMDITERKKAEAVLRTSEKLAATGRLASTLAHEINNPLAAVTNIIYLLMQKHQLENDTLTHLTLADEELRRVSLITRNLLSFHREPIQPVQVRMATIVEDVLVLHGPKLREKQMLVETQLDHTAHIVAYPGEMRQIFANLISNAIEASPTGKKLSIRISQSPSGKKPVRVLVCDEGPGISRENSERIFEPFFTTKGEKGTGLGLWITRDLVSKHHGRIKVRSSHRGTCFAVELPSKPRDLAKSADSSSLA